MGGAGGYLELRGRFERHGDIDGLGTGIDAVREAEEVPVDVNGRAFGMQLDELRDERTHTAHAFEGNGRARAVDEDALEFEADCLAGRIFVAALEHADEGFEILAERSGEGGDGRGSVAGHRFSSNWAY